MITFLSVMIVITMFIPFILWSAFNFKPDFFRHLKKWKTIGWTWLICWSLAAMFMGLTFLFI